MLSSIAVAVGAVSGAVSSVVKSIDVVAIGKSLARIAVISGMVVLIISTAFVFVNTMTTILNLLHTYSDQLSNVLSSSSSSSVLSCMYYLLNGLGITEIINSFFTSFVGLVLIWSGFKLQIIVLRFSITMTGTALKVI